MVLLYLMILLYLINFFCIYMMKFSLVPHIDHASLYRTDNNAYAFCRRMDHLASADVDPAVSCVDTYITRLRI